MSNHEKIAIIGGGGNMGRLTADLSRVIGLEPLLSDPRLPESLTTKEAIQQAKVIFFSVLPIEEIDRIVEETKDSFGPEHIVIDNASLKKPLAQAFKTLEEKGVSICSTHPLCKHDQPLHGQKVIIMDVGQNPNRARDLAQQLYKSAGMIIVPFSLENHDRSMNVLQLVPHVMMRSVAAMLARQGFDMQALADIAPANFQLFNLSLWRTIVQDPRISSMLIGKLTKTPEGEALIDGIKNAIDQISTEEDEEVLVKMFQEATDALDTGGISNAMNQTTTIILERLANLGVRSLNIEVSEDRAGLLRKLLLPFEEEGISLTAIDSHKNQDILRFEIGLDEQTISTEKVARLITELQKMGCSIGNVTF